MTDRIREKMAETRAANRKVGENLPNTVDAFTSMGLEKDGIYKNVEHAIQAVYDICALIVKEHDLGIPSEERKLPDMLADAGIIDDDLAATLKDMKGTGSALRGTCSSSILEENDAGFRTICHTGTATSTTGKHTKTSRTVWTTSNSSCPG